MSRLAYSPLPRALWFMSLAVLAACTVMTLWGAWTSGASLDESFHVQRMQNYLDHGWFLIDRQMAGSEPADGVADRFVYGPVTMILLHALSVLCGVEGTREIAATPEAYAVRHLGIAMIALVGVMATAAMGRVVLASWRWGAVAAALLMTTPMWTGHSMFNPKDISVASGYALLTLGLMLLASDEAQRGRSRLSSVLLVAVGVTLAVGTRPGMWAGVVASVVAFVALRGAADLRGRGTGRRDGRYLDLGAGLGLAGAALALVYPAIFLSPAMVVMRSASSSSDYEGASAGAWWYIPAYVAVTVPIIVIVLTAIGVHNALGRVITRLTRLSASEVRLALLGVQALALPVVAMVVEAKLYNGLRHFLFALPALMVLCVIGLSAVLGAEVARQRLYTTIVSMIVVAGMLLPVVDQVRLFPYNYTYYNEIAESAGVDTQTDWWWTSGRELAEHFPPGSYVSCVRQLTSEGIAYPQWLDLQSGCLDNPVGTLAPYVTHAADNGIEPPLSEVEFLATTWEVSGVADNCSVIHEVVRPRRWHDAVMGYALRCTLVAPTYRGPVAFPPSSALDASVLDGWRASPQATGMTLAASGGRIAVGIPDDLRGSTLAVRLLARNADVVAALRVNGIVQPFRVLTVAGSAASQAIEVRVDTQVAARLGEGRLILGFERSEEATDEQDFELRSLELTGDAGAESGPQGR